VTEGDGSHRCRIFKKPLALYQFLRRSKHPAAHLPWRLPRPTGKFETRDEAAARYREALLRRPEKTARPDHVCPCDLASIEAAMGRYEAALAMLPALRGEQACARRRLLIELMLGEGGPEFELQPDRALFRYWELD
jgi:hypothetical protein